MEQDGPLTYILASLILYLTWRTLRGGLASPATSVHMGSRSSVILGILAIAAAMWLFGVVLGLLLILTVVIHEFGHVAAYRVAGHSDARFRLIPFVGGVAISDRPPQSALHDFYVTIMGPGICLSVVVASNLLSHVLLTEGYRDLAVIAQVFASLTAALNLFNLLPLIPLDGGHAIRCIFQTLYPPLVRPIAYGVAGIFGVLGFMSMNMILIFLAIYGFSMARRILNKPVRVPAMSRSEALTALGAYITMCAAFALAIRLSVVPFFS